MQAALAIEQPLKPADRAKPPLTLDFWPASSLKAWRESPKESFRVWLSEKHVIGNQGFRESSFETYQAMFSTWFRFLAGRDLDLLDARPVDAASFFFSHNLEQVSRRRYLQLLDKLYQHLHAIGWDGEHPLLEELAKERVLPVDWPKGLCSEDLAKLVRYLIKAPGWKGARDRVVLALTVGAGLRNNELVNLKKSALAPSANHTIDVKPSGVHRPHTTIVLPYMEIEDDSGSKLGLTWAAALTDWHHARLEIGIPGDWAIPATKAGKAYCASGVFRRICKWFEDAGIQPGQGGVNVLRNTFAHLAIRSGRYTVAQIQEFLGHEQPRATERYLKAAGAQSLSE